MSIRYVIDLPCRVREALGTEELENLLGRWQRAQAVAGQFRAQHGVEDEEEMQYRERQESAGSEPAMLNTTVAATRRACRALEELAPTCAGCPAALTRTPFSCIQEVGLPVGVEAEAWLAARLAGPEGRLGQHVAALMGGALEAESLGAWRKAGFLAAAAPMETAWAPDASSDDMLAMLLLRGGFQLGEIPILLAAFDLLETENGLRGEAVVEMMESLSGTGESGDVPAIGFSPGPDVPAHEGVRDFLRFFYAAYVALGLQVSLAVRA